MIYKIIIKLNSINLPCWILRGGQRPFVSCWSNWRLRHCCLRGTEAVSWNWIVISLTRKDQLMRGNLVMVHLLMVFISMATIEFNGSCLVTFPWCSLWAEHSHWLRGRQRRKREPTRDILWNMPSPEKLIQGWQKPHSRCYLKTGSRHHHSPHWMDNNSLQSVKRRDSGSPGPEDKIWKWFSVI